MLRLHHVSVALGYAATATRPPTSVARPKGLRAATQGDCWQGDSEALVSTWRAFRVSRGSQPDVKDNTTSHIIACSWRQRLDLACDLLTAFSFLSPRRSFAQCAPQPRLPPRRPPARIWQAVHRPHDARPLTGVPRAPPVERTAAGGRHAAHAEQQPRARPPDRGQLPSPGRLCPSNARRTAGRARGVGKGGEHVWEVDGAGDE